jgi:RES domain-containing protein
MVLGPCSAAPAGILPAGVPRNQGYIETHIPAALSIERATPADVPHWDSQSFEAAQAFGDRWYDDRRTPVLIVPSVVTPVERNVPINQEHPAFSGIRASKPLPVHWDARLWRVR